MLSLSTYANDPLYPQYDGCSHASIQSSPLYNISARKQTTYIPAPVPVLFYSAFKTVHQLLKQHNKKLLRCYETNKRYTNQYEKEEKALTLA